MPYKYRGAEQLHLGTRWGWLVKAIPWPFSPGQKPRFSLYRMLGEPQGQSGWLWRQNLYAPLEFETQTIHPVTSHYIKLSCPQNIIIIEFNFKYHGSHSNHTAAGSVFAVLFHVSPGANTTLMELPENIKILLKLFGE